MRLADLRQALRYLRRRPAFALAAVLTLALGVGANTAVYQVIYTVLLRPSPFREPLVGRNFSATEEREKRAVALIGEKLWRRKFGADPAIVGKAIRLETESFTVIGRRSRSWPGRIGRAHAIPDFELAGDDAAGEDE